MVVKVWGPPGLNVSVPIYIVLRWMTLYTCMLNRICRTDGPNCAHLQAWEESTRVLLACTRICDSQLTQSMFKLLHKGPTSKNN
jgi:hypothetical protein